MDVWATISKVPAKGKIIPAYKFDDSIIIDKDAQFQQDLRLLDRVMSKVEFRMRNFGEDEETAQEKIDLMNAEKQKESMFEDDEQLAGETIF